MDENMNCLDDQTGETCEGEVEYRMALSGTGQPFPRCDKHWDERLDRQAEISERYGVPMYYTGNPRDYEDYDY